MKRIAGIALGVAAALSLAGTSLATYAANAPNAGVAVRVFAGDVPAGFDYQVITDGGQSPASASKSIAVTRGSAAAQAQAQADALSGALRVKANSNVGANVYVVGRNSGATASASTSGDIIVSGSALPGLATFTAVLDGTYSVATPAPSDRENADNKVDVQYSLNLGGSREFNDRFILLCCSPGTFSIPFTWTQVVTVGDVLFFSLFLRTDVTTVAGTAMVDMTNTFKITGVGLPAGMSYNRDAGGFLSQFGGAVTPPDTAVIPLPASLWLFTAALGIFAVGLRRRRRDA